ncbi:hypothetical protein [Halarcobacter anaerophilus]|uniref:Uncharacterized protein n=1 Tax=Halarcobacter anaerophilus TaxID=877500 RepID=A0A4V1LPX4_9BACT|nr:hypothetical protein [Halarcobacter anaerophilus]QDF29788.1 hypothetical protein AANAER_2329 [Halarcobacter anaerophilus]RXJ62708.1 hypothetical protein CRV06_09585 [Halarcobacter anaerophilus]
MFIILLYEINSTEEISSKNIDTFILTNLRIKGLSFEKNNRIFYSYIKRLSLYQVIVFKKSIPPFLFFKSLYENEIFFDKDYVVVYKNKNLFYYQKLENEFSISDISAFLKQRLGLENIHTSDISKTKIDKNKKYNFIKPVKSYSFRYFIIYFFILLILFSSFEFNNKKNRTNFEEIKRSNKDLKKQLEFYSVSKELKEIFSFAQTNNSKIASIILNNSKIKVQIESKNKKNIYAFFKKLDKNSIENIVYDKEKERFIGDAIYEINRR